MRWQGDQRDDAERVRGCKPVIREQESGDARGYGRRQENLRREFGLTARKQSMKNRETSGDGEQSQQNV